MKYFLLLGGSTGFSLAFACSLLGGNEMVIALRNGAIGCFIGALLMKGLFHVVIRSIEGLAENRMKARVQNNDVDEII